MSNNHTDIMDKELYDYLCEFEGCQFDDEDDCDDCREICDTYWKSGLEDIDGGDNFIDYCEYFFGVLEEEGYYE
jgi:hypothetical protein